MSDIQINSALDVFIDKTGDLALAEGRDALNQRIALSLIDFYNDVIGENDPGTALEQVRVGARRAVGSIDDMDSLQTVDARFSDDSPNTIIVDIIFDTGDPLQFTFGASDTGSVTDTRVYDDGVYESTTSFDVYEDGTMQ